jgi:cytolysin (calcineurin-like family phosphatase)
MIKISCQVLFYNVQKIENEIVNYLRAELKNIYRLHILRSFTFWKGNYSATTYCVI